MSSEQRLDRIEAAIEKQNTGIQGLIVASRQLITHGENLQASVQDMLASAQEQHASIEQLRILQQSMMEEMRELSKATDEKLNILVDTVDKIIRHKGPNGHEG
jgi:hypothetical protein